MTLIEAFSELTESVDFREIAKLKTPMGGKYRSYISRFKKGELKAGAITELLLRHGYEIKANKAKKKIG